MPNYFRKPREFVPASKSTKIFLLKVIFSTPSVYKEYNYVFRACCSSLSLTNTSLRWANNIHIYVPKSIYYESILHSESNDIYFISYMLVFCYIKLEIIWFLKMLELHLGGLSIYVEDIF